jgi:ABC-2 type transport system permease protein
LAYRSNLWISLLHSLLNFCTGVLGLAVVFGQVDSIRGWSFAATLSLLGVYLILTAVHGLVIGPSLDAMAGPEGEVVSGQFDYTLLRPVNVQFLASVRYWRPPACADLVLGLGTMACAIQQPGYTMNPVLLLAFLIALVAGITILYAILLSFSVLVLWCPGILLTWLFDAVFQMARYPVELYPGWLRLVLTWIVPVGVMTTIPAQALTGDLPIRSLIGSVALAAVLFWGSSALFQFGLKRYASASS